MLISKYQDSLDSKWNIILTLMDFEFITGQIKSQETLNKVHNENA